MKTKDFELLRAEVCMLSGKVLVYDNKGNIKERNYQGEVSLLVWRVIRLFVTGFGNDILFVWR